MDFHCMNQFQACVIPQQDSSWGERCSLRSSRTRRNTSIPALAIRLANTFSIGDTHAVAKVVDTGVQGVRRRRLGIVVRVVVPMLVRIGRTLTALADD